jgi:ankyrin repeat protein
VLLNAGADPQKANSRGVSALFHAAQGGHVAAILALLQSQMKGNSTLIGYSEVLNRLFRAGFTLLQIHDGGDGTGARESMYICI